MIESNNPYIVKPLFKALRVLDVLAEAEDGLSLGVIIKRAAVPKTTAYKYLQTFVASGYVIYDLERETYRLGLRLFELGQRVSQRLGVQQVALPFMNALRDQLDETVNLAVLDGGKVLCLASVNSNQSLRMQTPPGTREGTHATALGKAMLSFIPETEWDRHLAGRLQTYTPHTITDKEQIKRELRLTRARGYAIDNEETTLSAYCVGAPILNQSRGLEAAISVSLPISRMIPEIEIAQAVMTAAAGISERLGYSAAHLDDQLEFQVSGKPKR